MPSPAPGTDKLPGCDSLGNSSAEKDLVGLAEHEPAARPCSSDSWQRMGLSPWSTASWPRGAITPPSTHTALVKPQAGCCTQFGICQYKTGISHLRQVQWKATKMVMGWNTCAGRRSWGLSASSACRRDGFRGDLRAACCYLQGCHQENRTRLLSEVQGGRTRELKETNTTPATATLIHRNILWTTGCPLA